ncbi:Hypothetical protein FKW44_004683 [Caligus rogercresseyi]|uniref:Uncharacterized protein n=1 Tax=Caligus rogercresseyi TaxID=217165 RepID=A0A7T8KAS4_CALRO|nr:Hypothetical protein FKW44_004683 [Caligus rogercresseyi]
MSANCSKKDSLAAVNLDVSCCVRCATDGAPNLKGTYESFSASSQKKPPTKYMCGAIHMC